jgi:hypothetical protein
MSFLDLNTDVKPWLGIEVSNTQHDEILQILIDAMEQAVINYVETDFTIHTETKEIHDGNRMDVILPRNVPITAVDKIRLGTDTQGDGGTELVDTDYSWDSQSISLRYQYTPRGRGMVAIDYKWGYDGLPPDVKLCMLQAVEAEFRRKGNKSLGGGSKSKKDESQSSPSGNSDWDQKTGLPSVLVYKLTAYKTFEFPNLPAATRGI